MRVIEFVRRPVTAGDDAKKEVADAAAELFACGMCGTVYSPRIYVAPNDQAREAAFRDAERCCAPQFCACGEPVKKYYLACDSCRAKTSAAKDQARVDAAEKIPLDQVVGPVMYNDDRFYAEPSMLLDELADNIDPVEMDEISFPLVAWVCESVTPQLDATDILDALEESLELGEDVVLENVINEPEEVFAFVASWNAKQEPKLWVPRDDQCVLIQRDDLPLEE